MTNKIFRQLNMEDALPYANPLRLNESDELLIIDNLQSVDFSDKTLQVSFFIFCYCSRGEASFKLNGKMQTMKPGDLLVALGEQVFDECYKSEDFNGAMILESRQFLGDSMQGLLHLCPHLIYLLEHPVLHLNTQEQHWVHQCYAMITSRLKDTSHLYRRESIISLMRTYYFDTCNLLARRSQHLPTKNNRSYDIFDSFVRLLSANFRRERNVAWYSEQLCLTPKYLSEVVKSVSGRTAGMWITNMVIMEVKALLCNTSLTIKQIAFQLNFPNQSFLGKYFKNLTGVSPTEYRKNN